MNKNPGAKQFWRLCGPLLLYWLIEIVVKTIASIILMAPHLAEMMSKQIMLGEDITQQEQADLFMQTFEKTSGVIAEHYVLILAIAAICTIPMTYFLFHSDRKKERMLETALNKKAGLSKYGQIVVLGIAVSTAMNCLYLMSRAAFKSEEYQKTSEVFYSADLWLQFIGLGLIIPLAEELIYRGLLFKRYREKGTFLNAALCSAIIFALTHGNIVQTLYGFILGMLLAYVYEKYGSFKAPAVLHIVANTMSLLMTETSGLVWLAQKPVRMGIATIICAFIGSVMFVLIQRIDEKPEGAEPPKENKITPDMFR